MKNINNFTEKEMKIVADLRIKSVTKFINELNQGNDILEIMISRNIPGGVRCFMNMEATFSVLFIMYIEMLKNNVPNDVLKEVFFNLAMDVIKKAKLATEEGES